MGHLRASVSPQGHTQLLFRTAFFELKPPQATAVGRRTSALEIMQNRKPETYPTLWISRRRFLFSASSVVGSIALAGCGGSSDAAAPAPAGTTPSPSPTPTPTPSPTPTPVPTPPIQPSGSMAFHLVSAVGGNVPFAVGFAFREGDIPSNAVLGTDFAEFQVTRKNAWPDGSLKFAILSGRASLQPNTLRTVTLRTGGTAASGSAVSTATLKATGISASVSYGSYGTAMWSGSDWDAPFQNWISGPEMSSWVYRKGIGSDAHLVAWLEVRCWAGGQVEVVPWIENGYLNVASPGERSGTATFTLGGTQRFAQSLTLYNHTRAVLASGTTLTHWLGTDPQLSWKHDTAYFTSTRLVPNYAGVTPSSASALSSLVTSYTPLAQADHSPAMGTTGYHKSIGLLPEWDVLYLTASADDRAWRAIQVNAYCAGRYGVHFRDENTNRSPRMSQYPNLALDSTNSGIGDIGGSSTNSYTPAASGGSPPAFKTSHMPSLGYMAYLITGRWYFMDGVQLWASMNFLKQTNTLRGTTQYIIDAASGANQVRGAAWGIRLLAQAACITPDDDVMRAEYVNSANSNIVRYHATYVRNGDPVSAIQGQADFESTEAGRQQSPWEDDFFTAAFAFLADQKVHSTSNQTALTEFLAWKFQYIVGRLGPGTAGTFNFEHAAAYRGTVAPASAPDYAGKTGPWFANWGEVASAMGVPANAGTRTLQGTSGANPSEMSTGYWGNLHPAIAYAVDHGAAGASAAWARLTGATNYAASAAGFNDVPEWGIVPRK